MRVKLPILIAIDRREEQAGAFHLQVPSFFIKIPGDIIIFFRWGGKIFREGGYYYQAGSHHF